MKKLFLTLVCAVFALTASAQYRTEIRADFGIQIPLSDHYNSGMQAGLSLTHFFSDMFGARLGGVYLPKSMGIQSAVGVPIALVMHKAPRSGYYGGYGSGGYISGGNLAVDVAGTFFDALFQRSDIFMGVTPGYFLGDSVVEGEAVKNRFFATVDAGATLAIPLGRFSITVTPAAHFYLTDNFEPTQGLSNNPGTINVAGSYLRMQFIIAAGLAYGF